MSRQQSLRKTLVEKFDDELKFFKGWIDKPKAFALRATAVPMRPMPTMPRRLPQMRWPSIQVGDQPVHLPSERKT